MNEELLNLALSFKLVMLGANDLSYHINFLRAKFNKSLWVWEDGDTIWMTSFEPMSFSFKDVEFYNLNDYHPTMYRFSEDELLSFRFYLSFDDFHDEWLVSRTLLE